MKPESDDRLLEEAIRRATGPKPVRFDASRWTEKYRKEVLLIESRKRGAGNGLTDARRIWRTIMHNRLLQMAAAAAALVIVFGSLSFWGLYSRGSVAFAQVLKNVQSVRSVQFKATAPLPVPGLGTQTVTTDVIIVEPDRMRQTIPPSALMPGGMITIWDFGQGRCLTFNPLVKQGMVTQMTNGPSNQKPANLLDIFRRLHEKAGIPIGEKEIAGRLTKGFKVGVPPTDMEMLIWADTETRLPVLIEMTMKSGTPPTTTTSSWTDFVWDVEVDKSLISLTPPGVSITPAESHTDDTVTVSLNLGTATERDMIEGLKTTAELNDGKFPAVLDPQSQQGRFMKWLMAFTHNDPAKRKEAEAKGIQLMSRIGLAWKFIIEPKNGDDFHYAGKDVPAGQAGTPILWYRPKDSVTYRVIDADLTVRDVAPADLPTVPSTLLRPTTAAAPAHPPQQ